MFRGSRDRGPRCPGQGQQRHLRGLPEFRKHPRPRRFLPGARPHLVSVAAVQVGQFGVGLEYWRPGLAAALEQAADDGGAPMMTLAALRRCHQGGPTPADLIDRLG